VRSSIKVAQASARRVARALARGVAQALACLTALTCIAGPADFGVAEYNAALASRNLKWKVKYDVSLDPPETYRIEPYAAGGAHISGGDLRGLMYGLLEAADQIRLTGRMKQSRGAPATAIRAIRRFARDDVSDWRPYFETLARDRFNRFTLIYSEPPADFEKLRSISQTAADYGIDFTLGLWYELGGNPGQNLENASIEKIIAACPMIRSVQIRTMSHDLDRYRSFVFKPLHNAGRRIALDPDPEVLTVAEQEGVAIRSDPKFILESWPPNFEIEAPADFETHSEFYWLWGRLGYDPKSKPAHGENPDEFRSAAEIIALLAESRAPANSWIASASESAANRANNVASAKPTPLDLADSLVAAAKQLSPSSLPDFQLLAQLSSNEAVRLRAAAQAAGLSAEDSGREPLARPQFTHIVVHTSPPDQPITVTLQIAPIKDVRTVRLHYRALDSAATSVMEKPAAPSVAFTIPAASSDLLYYFEILDRLNGGWFEPDPASATPYHVIRIQPKP
jgi:hypothetical protein